MPTLFPELSDGDFCQLGETEGREPFFPFTASVPPDAYSRIHYRTFEIDRASYVPAIAQRTAVTNLLTYSEDFAHADWTKNSGTNAAAQRANPDTGQATMSRLLEVAASAEHSYSRAYTFTAVLHTLFVHVAPGLGRDWFRLKANDGTTNFTCFFDLLNGRVGTAAGGATGEIVALDDGSFLCSIAFTPLAAVGSITFNIASDGATVSYLGDVAKGLYFWGAQLQVGARGAYVVTTTASRTGMAPLVDSEDPFAFLAKEDSVAASSADMLVINRVFARIPGAQLSYPGSRQIGKPDYTPTAAANPYTTGGSSQGTAWRYTDIFNLGASYLSGGTNLYTGGDSKVYSPVKSVGLTPTKGYATAGTFTLTYKTSTTAAIAYNASTATIAAALNGLADIIADGITCTVPLNFMTYTTGGGMDISLSPASSTSITMNATGLTVTTSKNPTTWRLNGYQQIQLPSHYTVTAHGFSTSLDLAVAYPAAPTTYIYPTGYWGSIDANTLWFSNPGSNVAAQYAATYSNTYSAPATASYVGGTRKVRHRSEQTFALPGFTVGVTTPADIVVPSDMQNPETFLAALLAPLTGWQVYDSEGPAPWPEAPAIYRLEATQVKFEDLV
jgi:hypothetical protein